ncbi:hypothetical protein Back2_23770 [Nocardioides baekrokdamisoli]|uniref:Ribonuclease E n=1 Tax=Nocardioides baekrokdamisoli TaxID=1804624 RepID=A0A3G9IGB2_9ACTN|nr:Rne/Rng family ribonuclease [Nocardioides baekrokdamisoli]BBH18090.1 hypothetical protein Back2_23770 [Nocardioides baekrokdamisoli]
MTNDSSTTPEATTDVTVEESSAPAKKAPAKKAAAKKATTSAPAKKAAAKKAPAKKAAAAAEDDESAAPAKKAPAKKAAAKKAPAKKAAAKRPAKKAAAAPVEPLEVEAADETSAPAAPAALFQVPEKAPAAKRRSKAVAKPAPEPAEDDELELDAEDGDAAGTDDEVVEADIDADDAEDEDAEENEDGSPTPARRRRRRGGRRRRKGPNSGGNAQAGDDDAEDDEDETDPENIESDDQVDGEETEGEGGSANSRRRRRRRRAGESGGTSDDDPENTVTRVRETRTAEQQITSISGSTRLEAKKQRRREGREAGRRRAPIVSEAEFLARRESVDRVMVIRQREDLTQIAVLEDKVLVEHYVARESQTSMIGDIYLGRVQNVLPSMEAAFVDIGKGRNAVLYAGEVNWPSLGWKDGQPRKIESVLSAGQTILVQVTKDPIGHKGARLTSQISLAGRFLVYVPDGTTSGISRKLPDTERNRLKALLKEIVPDTAGVIVRTAAEGASEEELTRDVERLKARWADIEAKVGGNAPQQLHGEPDLTLKVVRDLFTEDFSKLVVQGDDAWATVQGYVQHVAPDLEERLERFAVGDSAGSNNGKDAFQTYRIDEQISKGLDRKVWLPSGGSLIIDRTEAMTVIDVNTGKFTGSGGNLEETVTRNNLEAAEEVVRQLRLRDIGGIIVVDFIDMVLESNRDLVLRRMVECLGRDRTRHQVAEVTSLGLVQMTRKRIGTGLLEAFSSNCTHCQGRGVVVHDHPVEDRGGNSGSGAGGEERRPRRSRGGRAATVVAEVDGDHKIPSPATFAAMARHEGEDGELTDSVEGDAVVAVEPETEVVETPAQAEVEAVTVEAEQSEAPTEEFVAAVVDEPVTETAVEVVEAAPETPSVPEAPKVLTRTRGGARRAVVSTGEAVSLVADDVAPAVIETPAVSAVTTRTRGAKAPAAESPVAHVPVKKKR